MKMNFRRCLLWLPASFLLLSQAPSIAGETKNSSAVPKRREDQIVAFHEARTASRPYDADAWRMLSGAYVSRAVATGDGADYDRGWEMLKKAEDLDPGDPRILQARAELQLSRHHFQNARTLSERGLAQNPESPDFLAVAGDGALETGDFDAATAYYRHLNKVSPRLTTWARLAHVAEMRGNLEEASDMLKKALETGYNQGSLPQARAWCRAVLGEIELHRGHGDEARKQYELGLKDSPNHLLVLEHFAELEQAEGHLTAAEALYRNILSQREDPKAELRLAAILASRGAKHEAATYRAAALRFYQRAVASGNEGYLRPLAVFELSLGHFDRAESLQARDVTLRPTGESRAVLQIIQDSAAAAGQPLTAPRAIP